MMVGEVGGSRGKREEGRKEREKKMVGEERHRCGMT